MINGSSRAYRGISVSDIAYLSIEVVDFRAFRGNAINASNVAELVVFSVEIEESSGHGVYVYANNTRVEMRDVDVRDTRYDGIRVRLYDQAFAEIRDVSVTDSGRVEAAQPDRQRGGIGVEAAHRATAVLSGTRYEEIAEGRDRSDGSRDFVGIVVNGIDQAQITLTDASVIGPADTALQLTTSHNSTIDVETLLVDGVIVHSTEHAIDIATSDTARVGITDFRAANSGSLLASLGEDSQVRLSHGIFDHSGTEAAMAVMGTGTTSGRFEAHELTIQHAPWMGIVFEGVAETDLTAVTFTDNGVLEPGPALLLRDNDVVRVTHSTITGNHGVGVAVVGSGVQQQVHISSTTIADNTAEQFAVLVRDTGSPGPNVNLRNSIVSGDTELQLAGSRDGWELDHGGLTSSFNLWNGVSNEFADFLDQTGTGNIVNVDPQIGALADNGGFTQTRLPAADSPVIDAGDPDSTGTPDLDQRGAARIDGVIDMGSVEVGTLDEPGDGEPGDGEPGDGGAQNLPSTGASGVVGLLTSGGVMALAGLVLLLARLRLRPN